MKETLIYSYFPFLVDKIVQTDDNYWLITLKQSEINIVFSKNCEKMESYWSSIIREELSAELKDGQRLKENLIDPIIENLEKNEAIIHDDNIFLEVIKESIFIIVCNSLIMFLSN